MGVEKQESGSDKLVGMFSLQRECCWDASLAQRECALAVWWRGKPQGPLYHAEARCVGGEVGRIPLQAQTDDRLQNTVFLCEQEIVSLRELTIAVDGWAGASCGPSGTGETTALTDPVKKFESTLQEAPLLC